MLPIRILSDLHFGDPACRVDRFEQLAPIFDGASRVVFNGDTVEARRGRDREQLAVELDEIRAFCDAQDAATDFLTGNHDPDFTPRHFIDLARDRVFVTHGDILFDDICPWGHEVRRLRRAHRRLRDRFPPADPNDLNAWMRLNKRASRILPSIETEGIPSGVRLVLHLLRQLWPPWRPYYILRTWREVPRRAAALAARFRPGAAVIIVGHTHYPGAWRSGEYWVVNTGAWIPPFGPLVAEVTDHAVTVRRVEERSGSFHPGSVIREIPLPDAVAILTANFPFALG